MSRSLFPQENAPQLRDLLVSVTGRLMLAGSARITIRKLFVAVSIFLFKRNTLYSCIPRLRLLRSSLLL